MLATTLFALVNILAVSAAPVSDSSSHQLAARAAKLPSPILSTYISGYPDSWDDLDFGDWNVINMAFWLPEKSNNGAAEAWANLGKKQAEVKKKITDDGKRKLMLAVFGAKSSPSSTNKDPKKMAQEAAKQCIDNNYDGVDVDWEDFPYMDKPNDAAFKWLDAFQTELAAQLKGKDKNYIISHAPVTYWFVEKDAPWIRFNKKHADTIDYYNIQFYNGWTGQNNCDDTFVTKDHKDASVANLIDIGIPANKIVIGKEVQPKDEPKKEIWSGKDVGVCIGKHKDVGVAGAMLWQTYPTKKEMETSRQWVADMKKAAGY